ncbi:rho GTPase-activating protein REN1 isoform X1 [Ziziphus jujuba]|uniref:Rho GTPase-activating protein REN1 isoform X1 n=1 Tax=Ziziphus jujuba TaxID=326968 RepID=A0A6P4AJR4_ZIZJJ|nr:rho GTPase-activating protein REN1 isoform X1 [Ziziphus jujuba]
MSTRITEQPSQGESGSPPPPAPPGPPDHLRSRGGNAVFKSGPLFISSKGIGWTSWKKRWFILTRNSLVFFRSDPSAVPQKGGEVNLTLGGIDLNNSGSVVVKADKKLLTVLFPDGRDGRAFTLKAETLEDLHEWKAALENALAQAPSAALAMGQNGIFRNDQTDSVDSTLDQSMDKQPVKSTVIGAPVLLALEDVDGAPSFLEKALKFIEEHGVKVEGILRQAADVDEVEKRVRDYEQGKVDFSPDEDAHVIADCIKHVLRELPSSPVPASCCNALLEACRTDRSIRVNAMREAIYDTFPEPNRRLLQRILMMMQIVSSHKSVNRMSCSAVAACMAPLLLRPLLAGECEIENDFDVGGDGSVQLLQAAAAANHAQAIVITLLDEYDKIFGEGSMSPDLYVNTEESGSDTEEETDDESYEDDEMTEESDIETDGDIENASSVTCSESGDSRDDDLDDDKEFDGSSSGSESHEIGDDQKAKQSSSSSNLETSLPQHDVISSEKESTQSNDNSVALANESAEIVEDTSMQISLVPKSSGPPSCMQKSTTISNGPLPSARPKTVWGRTSAKKNLSMESIDYPIDDEAEIKRLEVTKSELETRITEEAQENSVLQANLEKKKKTLHQRRIALEQDVARLQEQLQKERDLRVALEAGLKMSHGKLPNLTAVDEKTKAEIEEIAQAETDVINLSQKVDDLGMQLNQQRDYQVKLKEKQKDGEAPSNFERSRSKESRLGRMENENERKLEALSLSHKHPPQYQQLDSLRGNNYRSAGVPADSSTTHSAGAKHTGSNHSHSKRSGTKGEGSNSTTSALTKLTTRLNFLKERRSQIANELQNLDKSRGQPVQNLEKSRDSTQNPDKFQGLEQNAERGRETDGVGSEGQSFQNPEKLRKSESHSLNYADRGKRSEGQNQPSLDRGLSEGHISVNADKGQVVEGQPYISPPKPSR